MESANVRVGYNESENLEAIFVTIDDNDPVCQKILMDNDEDDCKEFVSNIAKYMIDFYELPSAPYTINVSYSGNNDICITITSVKLNVESMSKLVNTILPEILDKPIWQEWDEQDILKVIIANSLLQHTMEDNKQKNQENELTNSKLTSNIYIIPTLRDLFRFSFLQGKVLKNNGVWYLETPYDMSEFFTKADISLTNAEVVIPDVQHMLHQMSELEKD